MKNQVLSALFALFSLSVFAQIPSYVPANGLVGWWPFNGNANDESGNGNNGTVNGAILSSDRFGVTNKAYTFDGIDEYISATPSLPIGSAPRSVSSWFKTNASFINTSQYPALQAITGWGNPFSGSVIFNQMVLAPLGKGYFESGTNGNELYSTNSVNDGLWHFIVTTYNGMNSSVKLYIDGIIQDSTSNITLGTANSYFGIGNAPWANIPFQGDIDDVGIWNRTLTQCEIQDLYHAQLGSQAISAGIDQNICSGDQVTLNGSGGSAYQWNNNVVDGQLFTPTQTATYTVNGTDSLGCSGTDTVMVTLLENAASTQNQTALDSYTLNGQTYTQSGTYTQTVPAANGCDSVITLNLTLNFTGIHDLGNSTKILVKITDLNGKIIPRRKNTVMLFIYEDGTVERVVEME
jgi:hypothetical protein